MKKYILSAILLILVVFTVYKTIPSNPASSGEPVSATILNLSATSSSPACKSRIQINELFEYHRSIPYKIQNLTKEAAVQKKRVSDTTASVKKYEIAYNKAVKAHDAKVLAGQKSIATQLALVESLNKKIASTTKATTLTSLRKQLTSAQSKLTSIEKNNTDVLAASKSVMDGQRGFLNHYTEELKKAQDVYAQYLNGSMKTKLEADLVEAKKQLDKFNAMKDCPKTESVRQCTNEIDDDRDGTADCNDSDCANSATCKNKTPGTSTGGTTKPPTTTNPPVIDLPEGCSDGNYTDEASCVANGTWGTDYCSGGDGGAGQQDCEMNGGSWNQGEFTPNTWRPGKEAPSEIKSTQCMIDHGSPATYPNTDDGRLAYTNASIKCDITSGRSEEYICMDLYSWKEMLQQTINEKRKIAGEKGIDAPDYGSMWAEIRRLESMIDRYQDLQDLQNCTGTINNR